MAKSMRPRAYPFSLPLFLGVLLLALAGSVPAASVSGLFSAEVPVAGRQTEARNQAIGEAMARVLGKVSGYPQIAQRAELATALQQAPRYVQQYRYRADPRGAAGDPGELLRVQFDGVAVMRLLREQRLPIWGSNRPAILVWLGLERDAGRSLAAPEAEPDAWSALQRAADERGLPLLLPLFDLEDHDRLQAGDLWGDFESNIRAASERYAPDAILVAAASRRAGAWTLRWRLYQEGSGSDWQTSDPVLDQALAQGIERAADSLAARYAPMGGEVSDQGVQLRVAGVTDLADFGRVQAHLQGLDIVEGLRPLRIGPTASLFELHLIGSSQALQQALTLGGLLQPDSDPGVGTEGADPLFYRLRQ